MKFFGISAPAMKIIEKRVNEGGLIPKDHGLTDNGVIIPFAVK